VAANAVIVREGKVLLVEFSGGTPSAHYNFPGGGVELGETLEEAVQREVREEACLDVAVRRLLLIVESVGSRNTNTIRGRRVPWNELRFFFECTLVDGEQEPRLAATPDPNQTGHVWAPIGRLPDEPLLPQVGRELALALSEPEGRPMVIPSPHG
jgi:8-oxo-dGTP diphosphatase